MDSPRGQHASNASPEKSNVLNRGLLSVRDGVCQSPSHTTGACDEDGGDINQE